MLDSPPFRPAPKTHSLPSRLRVAVVWLGRRLPFTPALVLGISYIGFGALCHSVDFGLLAASFTTVFMFALPAQVVLVDQFGRDMSILAAALAVTFTGIRLLPMTVAVLPYLRLGKGRASVGYLAAHFVAVTMWIESMRRIPTIPGRIRTPYFFVMGVFFVSVALAGTVAGYLMAQYMSAGIAAALILLSPTYFFLGLLGNAGKLADLAPAVGGFAAAPLFMWLFPDYDLVVTGAVVGSLSFFLLRQRAAHRFVSRWRTGGRVAR